MHLKDTFYIVYDENRADKAVGNCYCDFYDSEELAKQSVQFSSQVLVEVKVEKRYKLGGLEEIKKPSI